jgi:hypothetical protein
MAEELAYKQYLHALKKYKKKHESISDKKGSTKVSKVSKEKAADLAAGPPPPPPTLSRPEPTKTFSALSELFPVGVQEGVSRNCHRMIELGRYIQLFVLDMREGDLGKAQTKWLSEAVEGSSHPWKIILSGVPLGLEEKKLITHIVSQKSADRNEVTLLAESETNVPDEPVAPVDEKVDL